MADLDTVSADTIEIYQGRIRAGCTQLDRTRPGWRKRVRGPRVVMERFDLCIVGQQAGLGNWATLREDYYRALASITGQPVDSPGDAHRVGVTLGFDVDWSLGGHGDDAFGLLASLWREELAAAP